VWAGVYPEAPHIPLRVEAGELDGRPVYFRLGGPWEGPAGAAGDGEAAPEPMFRKLLADAIVRCRSASTRRRDRS